MWADDIRVAITRICEPRTNRAISAANGRDRAGERARWVRFTRRRGPIAYGAIDWAGSHVAGILQNSSLPRVALSAAVISWCYRHPSPGHRTSTARDGAR